MSLAKKILLGLGLGILTGIFFGEDTRILMPFGEAYIRLLQMAVLPYVILSLIKGIGSLKDDEARSLTLRVGSVLGLFWLLAFASMSVLALTFPSHHGASFFSTALLSDPETIDFAKTYIPANPFHAMANGFIPPLVVFSIFVGVALIRHPKKAELFHLFGIMIDGLGKVSFTIGRLSPFGVFALVAGAAGNMSLDELGRIQVYLIVTTVVCVHLAVIVFPMTVSALTPFSYRDIMRVTHTALITASTTGNLMVVLPELISAAKKLFKNKDLDADEYIDIVIPVAFNFPNPGKLVLILFIIFAGWLTGNHLDPADLFNLFIFGVLTLFGSANIAIPSLLDAFHLPHDLFELFIVSRVASQYFIVLAEAMGLFCVTVLSVAAVSGHVTFKKTRLLRWAGVVGGSTLVFLLLLGVGFRMLPDRGNAAETMVRMQRSVHGVQTVQFLDQLPDPSTLDMRPIRTRVAEGQPIRIGFVSDRMPFSFRNEKGDVVGFDIDMAISFSRHIACPMVLVAVDEHTMGPALASGALDAVFATMGISARRELIGDFTHPVMDLTLGIAVPDYRRRDFSTFDAIRAAGPLRLGTDRLSSLDVDFVTEFPESTQRAFDNPAAYFQGELTDIDGFLGAAESLTAWTLLYPDYGVAVPKPGAVRFPAGYLVANGNQEMRLMMDGWLQEIRDNTYPKLYDHWVQGKGATQKKRRWSVLRDVLGQ